MVGHGAQACCARCHGRTRRILHEAELHSFGPAFDRAQSDGALRARLHVVRAGHASYGNGIACFSPATARCSSPPRSIALRPAHSSGQTSVAPTRRVSRYWVTGPMDARSDQITIQNLMDHRGGYTNTPTDATYDMRQIARDLSLSRPPTPLEIARRIYTTATSPQRQGRPTATRTSVIWSEWPSSNGSRA